MMRSDCSFADPDRLFELLAAPHLAMSADESAAYLARLTLLLAAQIGDERVVAAAIEAASLRPEHPMSDHGRR